MIVVPALSRRMLTEGRREAKDAAERQEMAHERRRKQVTFRVVKG